MILGELDLIPSRHNGHGQDNLGTPRSLGTITHFHLRLEHIGKTIRDRQTDAGAIHRATIRETNSSEMV